MRKTIMVAMILAAGIALGLVIAAVLGHFNPDFGKLDVTSLMIAFLGIIITGISIIGGFLILNTWNDIDKRAKEIVQRHYEEATERLKREQEDRQRSIDEKVKEAEQGINQLTAQNVRQLNRQMWLLRGFIILAGILVLPLWSRKGIIAEMQEWRQKRTNSH